MAATNSDSSGSAPGPPFIILDDSRVGGGWNQLFDAENAYNRTLSSLDARLGRGIDRRVSIRFRGTELRVVGRATTNLKMNYTIHRDPGGDAEREPETFPARMNISATAVGQDGLAPFIWALDDIPPFWENVFSITPYEGELQLDYVAYMPASDRVNRQDVVLVDDTHPYIQYRNSGDGVGFTRLENVPTLAGLPFGGTWVRLNRTGSSFETKFRGSKVAVYGALNHGPGRLRVRYSVEGRSPSVIQHFGSTHKANSTKWSLERLFAHTFTSEDARNGHKLEVTILECTGDQAFYLDYVTYEAVDRVQSTTPPADSDVGQLPSGRFSAGHIAAIVAAVLGCILLTLSTRRFLRYRHTKIRTRNATESGLHYRTPQPLDPRGISDTFCTEEPQPYPLQVLAERRREAALREEEEALPPWSPPQNPENAPPPPEFEPTTRPSERSSVPSSHVPISLTSSHPASTEVVSPSSQAVLDRSPGDPPAYAS